MTSKPAVSVLIVSYNTKDMTLACIESVRRFASQSEHEIIVVDNASGDGSAREIAQRFPDVTLIPSDKNLGFAGGNNLAARHATSDMLLLLNPDTLVLDNAIGKLLAFARANPDAGIWGGRTLFGDLTLNPSSVWRFMSLWSLFVQAIGLSSVFKQSALFSPESYGGWARDTERRVDIVSGCFLLITRALWLELHGFDERFFMYAEEADLCFRASKLGAKAMVTPDARIIHYGGASETVRSDKIRRLYAGKCTFIRKHMPAWKGFVAIELLKLGAAVRLSAYGLMARLRGLERHAIAAEQWRKVWQSRGDWSNGYEARPDQPKR